jgi:dihydroneopterin aldolase
MATIEMEIEIRKEIGIAPTEVGREQKLTIALRVDVADKHSDAAAASGDISDTLDYSRLRAVVHQVFDERRWNLLEEVTTAIRTRIKEIHHVQDARVSITKHHPWADVARLTLTR